MLKKIPITRPFLDEAEEKEVIATLRSGWISQGPKCAEFEKSLAEFTGVRFGKAVNSGTTAIFLALKACGVQPGDEVIVPAFTCVATLNPIEHLGAKPVLVDINLQNFGLEVSKLEAAISRKTRIILLVHLFGLAADAIRTLEIAERHQITLIEDAALGLGAKTGDRYTGSFGAAACHSFHPRKMITTGEGGMVVTNSETIANQVAELRNYGASMAAWSRHTSSLFELPVYEQAGYNYKMTDIQASLGLVQMGKLEQIIAARREIARFYDSQLGELDWLQLPQESCGFTHVYQSYVCLINRIQGEPLQSSVERRNRLWRHLAEHGIASVQGAQAMHTIHYYYQKYGWHPEDYPNAQRADLCSVALPIFPGLDQDDQERVIEAMQLFKP